VTAVQPEQLASLELQVRRVSLARRVLMVSLVSRDPVVFVVKKGHKESLVRQGRLGLKELQVYTTVLMS